MVRRLLRLSWREWADVLAAQAVLLWARVAVALRPRGSLVRRADGRSADAPGEVPPRVHRLGTALRRAARHGVIRPPCLVRAVALTRLLRLRGYPGAQVRVGVRRDGERMIAHAWVVYRGVVVGEEEGSLTGLVELPEAEVGL